MLEWRGAVHVLCGIVGIWNRDGRLVDRAGLRAAVASLAQRGPDDEGYVLIDSRSGRAVACRGDDTRARGLPGLDEVDGRFDLALGHRRLAIVDTSVNGHQPMSTPNGRLWIAFNGMIYNFQELRAELECHGVRFRSDTDTEVVLHAYDRWGTDCVQRFNGMWCFVLWDADARRLWISRDRLGIKSLVYRIDDRRALFASDVAALAPLRGLVEGLEPRALHHYLSLMQVPAPYTIQKGVFKLRPARNLTVDVSRVAEDRYWRPRPAASAAATVDEACEQLDALLRDAVRLRLVADVPVGSFVSGGIDSGTIAALAAAQQAGRPLPTYSIAVPRDKRSDESKWSRSIAAHIGSDHTQIDLGVAELERFLETNALRGEPFAISSLLGVHLIARAATPNVKVLLSGDGGDELFAGYPLRHVAVDDKWDRFARDGIGRLSPERVASAGQWVRWRRRTLLTMSSMGLRSLLTSELDGRDFEVMRRRCIFNDHEKRELYTRVWRAELHDEETIPWLRSMIPECDGDRVLRRQLHDLETGLHNEMTAKLEQGTISSGVEGRAPLLDHRVVEFAVSLPLAHRHAEGEGKWLLRRVAARYLPDEILKRPKHGFNVPVASWLRNDLRTLVHDTLSRSAVRRAQIFEPSVVDEVIAYYERDPQFHSAHMVYTLICFQIWHDRWQEKAR